MNILFTYCSSLYALQKKKNYMVWRGLFLSSLFIMLALRVDGVGKFAIQEQADYEPTTGNGSMGWGRSLYLIPREVEIQCLQSNKLS